MRKRACSFLIMLSYILMLTACAQTDGMESSTWQEQYDLGIRYLTEGSYEEAIIAFTAAIEIDPKQAPAYVGRGDAYSGVAQTLMEGVDNGELPAEVTSGYENAIADYLAALDLDGLAAEIYRKIADIYIILDDKDSAIVILEQGVSSTGNSDLQDYLDELTIIPPQYVLIQQDIYSAMSSGEQHSTFSYDKAGFLIAIDTWDVYEDGPEKHLSSVTYSYNKENKTWLREEAINGESKTEITESHPPGTSEYTSALSYPHGYAYARLFDISEMEGYTNQYTYDDQTRKMTIPLLREGYIAQYIYDDQGNAIQIDTYNESGILTGYCLLTWEKFSK